MTLKDCPRRPVGSARPQLFCSGGICLRFASVLCFCMRTRRNDRDDAGVGILPMPVRCLLDCLLTGRWCFRRRRLRSGHNNLRLRTSTGQLQPVGLCRFVQCKRRLCLALILRGLDDQRSWRRSNLDRNRRPQPNQTKKGEPHRPGQPRLLLSGGRWS